MLSNSRARVFSVDLAEHAQYRLETANGHSSVWISMTDGISLTDSSGHVHTTAAGEAHVEGPRQRLVFRGGKVSGRLIIVDARNPQQPLTVSSRSLGASGEQDDASSRSETLLLSVSQVRLSDTVYREEESRRESGVPRVIYLPPGRLAWLRPGIHRLTNIANKPVQFVSIEW